MNSEIFKKELTSIEDEKIRKFTETAIDNLPQYFLRWQLRPQVNITQPK